MKNLLFENIWFLSNKEKKARIITFHPRKNLIIGLNHTGKSSLIKNMFLALGAKPQGKLEHWDNTTICAVAFKINDKSYQVVHQRGSRALFEGDRLLLASSASKEWSEAFARLVNFNLLLTDKSTETVAADPKCFFLPFYIDQDGSWNAKWDTFVGLQQFKAPVKSILEYFTGIKPAKYYEVSSGKAQAQKTLDELLKEEKILNRAREKFSSALSLTSVKLQSGNFELEIERLTNEITILNTEQEKLKEASVREQELMHNIQLQINLANDTLATYDKDSSYLRKEEKGVLSCPTCGAEHNNSFLDVLVFADDARSLRDIVLTLSDDFNKVAIKHAETVKRLGELDKHYENVSSILEVRKGDFKLADVLESMGAETAFNVFEEESSELKAKINTNIVELNNYTEAMKSLQDRKRTKEILSTFRNAYKASLKGLNLPMIDTDKLSISSRPDLSGSGGPRSVLAYYAALWTTCRGERSDFSVPLVIDSPNQQGQDEFNLPVVMKFISEDLPSNSQIILGSENDADHFFDNRIKLTTPYGLLLENEYEQVYEIINPRIDLMYANLKAKQVD